MNIKEVAQEAGVSVATISRVLNGSEKVNPKTRQKVTKIIKKMKLFIYTNSCKIINVITFSYKVENARNELHWIRFVEHYVMELDWN